MPDPDMSDTAGSGSELDPSHLDPDPARSGSKPQLLLTTGKNYSFCTTTGKVGMTVYRRPNFYLSDKLVSDIYCIELK